MEAEKMKVREFEDLLQAMRAKEHAAVNAEQAAVVDSVGLHQRLQTALSENEKNVQVRTCRVLTGARRVPCAPSMHVRRETSGTHTHTHTHNTHTNQNDADLLTNTQPGTCELVQELRLLRSRREELEYELEKHRRLVSHESMDKDSATSELTTLKANVRELHGVVEQQNSALRAKQEEISLQRDRLLKIQAEAEANERRVRDLDTKLRMSEDANKVMARFSRGRDFSSIKREHILCKENTLYFVS
jgi:hypothetical protein